MTCVSTASLAAHSDVAFRLRRPPPQSAVCPAREITYVRSLADLAGCGVASANWRCKPPPSEGDTTMKSQTLTKMLLIVIVCLLTVTSMLRPLFQPEPVLAQGSIKFGYLQMQAGNSRNGGKQIVDLRDGSLWNCTFQTCVREGRYPLEQIK